MQIPPKYFHDRLVLFLLSVNTFVALLSALLTLLRIDGNQQTYDIQYRANQGISQYSFGGSSTFVGFAIFSLMILVLHTVLSMRVYSFHRQYAIAVLSLSVLLLVLAAIVSNALLVVST